MEHDASEPTEVPKPSVGKYGEGERAARYRPLRERYVAWWLDDLPPVDGRVRLLFYSGLLVFALLHQSSPLRAIAFYRTLDPLLWQPVGLMKALGLTHVPIDIVEWVRIATIASWVCAAVGLLTRFSVVLTAVGVTFLHGLFVYAIGFSHSWFVPCYALILMCFTRTDDAWSLDFHLRRLFGGKAREFRPLERISDTGFARKALLVICAGYYFNAGVSKLVDAGPRWLDGNSLRHFLDDRTGVIEPFLESYPWMYAGLSIVTLALELGSPLVLLSRRLRWLFVPSWVLMHVGMRQMIGPRYWGNSWCFLLLLDWGLLARWIRQTRLWPGKSIEPYGAAERNTQTSLHGEHDRPPARWSTAKLGLRQQIAVAMGTLLIPLWASVAIWKIDWWPLTPVDMYSSYYGKGLRAGFPAEDYADPQRVQLIARQVAHRTGSRHVRKNLVKRAYLLLAGPGNRAVLLPAGVGAASPKQWRKVMLTSVVPQDLAAKPLGRLEHDPGTQYPGTAFLEKLLPVIQQRVPYWYTFENALLVYRLKDRQVVIASVPLAP